jgi:glutamyl-tRNA reductase
VSIVRRLRPTVEAQADATPGPHRSAVLLVHAHPPTGHATGLIGRVAGREREAGSDPRLPGVGAALAGVLPEGWKVFTLEAGRRPRIAPLLDTMVAEGIEELVVVPLQPQFSDQGTGAFLPALYRALRRHGCRLSVAVRTAWYDDAAYVSALARLIAEHAQAKTLRPERTDLRFLAPPAPQTGAHDPWRDQVARTVELVAQRLGWPAARVSVDLEGGSSGDGEDVLVVPLGFAGAETAEADGTVVPPLHAYPPFIAALRHLVLHGTKPLPAAKEGRTPLLATGREADPATEPATFVMIGVSLEGGLRHGRGPAIRHSDPTAFGRVKKSHKSLQSFLAWVRERTPVLEAVVWNTCQRIEFYGWLPESGGAAAHERLIRRIRTELYGSEPDGLAVNVLRDAEARHHLLRTACGLNSDLPGDRDVAAQLQTACRLARCAGTAGSRAIAQVEAAVALAGEIAAGTDWGDFSTGYCAAAIARVFEVDGVMAAGRHHVVIGGSTTSRSVLSALIEQYRVPPRQVTAVYRDHHGQMKQLRAALGNGKRLRVHSYHDERVLRAIADADVVFFGIDQTEPVIEASALLDSRDLAARPLTVVDFNSFGSIDEDSDLDGVRLWTAGQLDQAVAAHVAITTTRTGFARAAEQAETRIERCLVEGTRPDHARGSRSGRPAEV